MIAIKGARRLYGIEWNGTRCYVMRMHEPGICGYIEMIISVIHRNLRIHTNDTVKRSADLIRSPL